MMFLGNSKQASEDGGDTVREELYVPPSLEYVDTGFIYLTSH
jgi:hypothetical protein